MIIRLTILFIAVILLPLFALAQGSDKNDANVKTIREGVGIEGVVVGRSTKEDIEKKFGKNYKWIENKKYSYQMTYADKGLSFYICQSDTKKQIFVIEIKQPYKGKTKRGITLGQSTLEDVYKLYGKNKTKDDLEYRGIGFYYNSIKGKKIITAMDIVENAGIRQCKVSK